MSGGQVMDQDYGADRPGAEQVVVGDGTTGRSRAAKRLRSARLPLIVGAILVLMALVLALAQPETSDTPLAANNPGPDGGRAVARVLEEQGVQVHYTQSSKEVIALARKGVTLAIFRSQVIPDAVITQLTHSGADLTLFEPSGTALEYSSERQVRPAHAGDSQPEVRAASCSGIDRSAAEIEAQIPAIRSAGRNYLATTPNATVCFPASSAQSSGSYIEHVRTDGVRIGIVDDSAIVLNESITAQGNAALALRVLGHNPELIWYVPEPAEFLETGDLPTGLFAVLPHQAVAVIWLAGVIILALILARGRRLGPVVTEPLPVLVPAAEATRGRGRLYRKQRSYGHASAGLRAGAADRLAARVGLPRSATAQQLIDALARATSRPETQISALLYGPPPTNDAEFVRLAAALDELENEVYQQ